MPISMVGVLPFSDYFTEFIFDLDSFFGITFYLQLNIRSDNQSQTAE